MFAKIASNQLFRRLENLDTGTLKLVTPDGKTRIFEGKNPGQHANMELRDWRVVSNLIRKGDIGLAEDYRAGNWETDDLTALTTLGLINKRTLENVVTGNNLYRTLSVLSYLLRLNSLKGSKKNIHAHYDLGNDFYQLWLDPSMTYSSAIFKDQSEPLEQAQYNKYDRILDCVGDNSGRLLEIGCGWGGFAERANQRGDFTVKGITLSEEQHAYAQRRLGPGADIVLEDYRHQQGKFDNIISIEMFEAVGERYWPTYFQKVSTLLKQGGKAVIQTITIDDQAFPRYRRGADFIRSYIFPGGMLPSPSVFKAEAKKCGLKTQNAFHFGHSYARTLEHWLEGFDQKYDQVKALGFDDGFIRLWRFYLSACIAGFNTGQTDVMQVELRHDA